MFRCRNSGQGVCQAGHRDSLSGEPKFVKSGSPFIFMVLEQQTSKQSGKHEKRTTETSPNRSAAIARQHQPARRRERGNGLTASILPDPLFRAFLAPVSTRGANLRSKKGTAGAP